MFQSPSTLRRDHNVRSGVTIDCLKRLRSGLFDTDKQHSLTDTRDVLVMRKDSQTNPLKRYHNTRQVYLGERSNTKDHALKWQEKSTGIQRIEKPLPMLDPKVPTEVLEPSHLTPEPVALDKDSQLITSDEICVRLYHSGAMLTRDIAASEMTWTHSNTTSPL